MDRPVPSTCQNHHPGHLPADPHRHGKWQRLAGWCRKAVLAAAKAICAEFLRDWMSKAIEALWD